MNIFDESVPDILNTNQVAELIQIKPHTLAVARCERHPAETARDVPERVALRGQVGGVRRPRLSRVYDGLAHRLLDLANGAGVASKSRPPEDDVALPPRAGWFEIPWHRQRVRVLTDWLRAVAG